MSAWPFGFVTWAGTGQFAAAVATLLAWCAGSVGSALASFPLASFPPDAWLLDPWLLDAWPVDAWLLDAWLPDAGLPDAGPAGEAALALPACPPPGPAAWLRCPLSTNPATPSGAKDPLKECTSTV
jgi:hypothetical protein